MKQGMAMLGLLIVVLCAGLAEARSWTIEYDEPTVNEAGTPLGSIPGVTLSKTQIKPVHNGTPLPVVDIPASGPSGGGHITSQIITADTGACVDDKLEVSVSAWNAVKESRNNPMTSHIDVKVSSEPCMTPSNPSNLKLSLNP